MRLLIVEDEVELSETVRRALGRAGWAVDLAADAAEAEEKVGLYAYDAVVLDLNLPDLDGVELCRRLRAGGLRVPVLMLTARHRVSDRVVGLDAGADDYLVNALGAGRRAVAGQFVVETLTVCLVALLVGGLIGGLVAQDTAQALLEKEMASLQSRRLGRAAVLSGGVSFIQGSPPASDQATPEIRVVFGWREVAAVLGLGLVLALSGSAASVWWSMRVEPMSILTSRT